ncbi:leucine zipper domain-containing protein [Bradyrhizobium sp. CCGUVB1N3]|uniref:leucine zipper domain-containing protein n=1 Tax=Bradyrhizobium sp. CCGUVB1N3 TaxID=2949629 RepID=UPI0020B22042|nr:leucine zipper domain-containing protein [Bradyrhizobium sp. CCGUVB1N3]MCP3476646.1 leucine zipper domain-containing protein [Bradyrhizobium sp. CCGUVB1N3]
MDIHENAWLTPRGRERVVRLVQSVLTPETSERAAGVCPRTARKWIDRCCPAAFLTRIDGVERPHYRQHQRSKTRIVAGNATR